MSLLFVSSLLSFHPIVTLYCCCEGYGYYENGPAEVHYAEVFDQHEVRVAALELIEPNVEDDRDVARHCQQDDDHNDDALERLVEDVDPPAFLLILRGP